MTIISVVFRGLTFSWASKVTRTYPSRAGPVFKRHGKDGNRACRSAATRAAWSLGGGALGCLLLAAVVGMDLLALPFPMRPDRTPIGAVSALGGACELLTAYLTRTLYGPAGDS